jgi:hypothetical protein
VNYSSATYKKTVANNGKCAYCHTAVSDTKGVSSATHNNNYINITGNVVGSINSSGLREVAKTCTNSCHKNAASTAPWGNYTTSSIKLTCVACHGDSSNGTGLTGNHAGHMGNSATMASGTAMNAAANAGCKNCHPDQVNDFWSAANRNDIGRGVNRAYAHASDGTNIVADNATLTAAITAATKAGVNTTCTNTCHPRSSTITWGAAMTCDMCHYYAASPTSAGNTGTGALTGAHGKHFDQGAVCTDCHGTAPSTAAHGSAYPIVAANATVTRASMTWNSGPKTCTNSGGTCHGSGTTPGWYTTGGGCATCHYYPGAAAGLGDGWTAGNGHASGVRHDAPVVNTHMKSTGFNYLTDTFAAVVADNTKCGLCHRNTKHRNGSGFAHLSSAAGSTYSQCGTTPFTFSTGGVGNGTNTTCGNVKCHSGKTTPNWW